MLSRRRSCLGQLVWRSSTCTAFATPWIARLRSLVDLVVEDDLAEWSARLHVERVSGEPVDSEVTEVIGSSSRPMSADDVSRKFVDLVEPVLPLSAVPLLELIVDLDQQPNLDPLLQLLLSTRATQLA